MSSLNLKSAADFDLFKPSNVNEVKYDVVNIEAKNLRHFSGHKFKLYQGTRFEEMTESIKEHGVIQPLIVRPVPENDFDYEILAGHNRLECGKSAGLSSFPCIIRNNLTEEEAKFYVRRTNLDQRSLSDLSHSEIALVLYEEYEDNKKQGKRNDLINDIDGIISTFGKVESDTDTQSTGKRTDEELGKIYSMSKDKFARYIRVNSLIQQFKDILDTEEIALSTAAIVSFLKEDEQEAVYDYITENNAKILTKHALGLKALSESGKFKAEKIDGIFKGKKPLKPPKPKKTIELKRSSFENYFNEEETAETIESTIVEALEFYYEYKDTILQTQKGGELNE